jgi:hypothetical protein
MARTLQLPDDSWRSAVEQATAGGARHAAGRHVIGLDEIYRRLAHTWTHEQLAACYQAAAERGAHRPDRAKTDDLTRPLQLLATAIPPTATLNVAVHVLHVLPEGARAALSEDLIATAKKNAGVALHGCHHALELDSDDRGYTVEEWRANVYEIATRMLESARPDEEPPTVVHQAQEAIGWLSRSIVELDQDSAETTAAMAETLARLLTVWVFADQAQVPGA